jgi:hypothetical protein
MKIKIKRQLNESMNEPEDTLPPKGSAPKPPGLMQKVKEFVGQAYDALKGAFAGELQRPEEEITPEEMMSAISVGATPRVQKILDDLAQERKQNAQIMSDYLEGLTVADLDKEQLAVDFNDQGYPPDMDTSGLEPYDPDNDPLGPLQEVARRHFPKR